MQACSKDVLKADGVNTAARCDRPGHASQSAAYFRLEKVRQPGLRKNLTNLSCRTLVATNENPLVLGLSIAHQNPVIPSGGSYSHRPATVKLQAATRRATATALATTPSCLVTTWSSIAQRSHSLATNSSSTPIVALGTPRPALTTTSLQNTPRRLLRGRSCVIINHGGQILVLSHNFFPQVSP